MLRLPHFLIGALMLILFGSAHSALLYQNSRYDFSCCATVSDLDWPFQIADGFVLSASGDVLVTSIYWTGSLSPQGSSVTDDFSIRFFADAGGRPDVDPFATFDIGSTASRTDWGNNNFSYVASIDPMRLAAGTQYYISIVANTAGSDSYWVWYAEDFPLGASRFDRETDGATWNGDGTRNYVFNLFGDLAPASTVPEPGTVALTIVALLALGAARIRWTPWFRSRSLSRSLATNRPSG